MSNLILKPESRLTFEGEELEIYHLNGQRWIKGASLAGALQIQPKTVREFYRNNRQEFTPEMTAAVTVATPGGPQQVRIFSPRGAMLVAMRSNSPKAAEVRVQVLDVLEGKAPPPLVSTPAPALAMLDAAQTELLRGNSVWRRIAKWRRMGLEIKHCAKLLDLDKSTVRQNIRRMEACGILATDAKLAQRQGNVVNFRQARLAHEGGAR